MSSARSLKEFIRERLTAAAEEIFTEFDKTILQYEEELDRQRRLLEICWKPQINLERIDLSHRYFWKEVLTEQPFCNEERNLSSHQDEPQPQQINSTQTHLQEEQGEEDLLYLKEEQGELQIKEEQHQLCVNLEEKQLELEQVTDACRGILTYEERDHRKPVPNSKALFVQNSSQSEDQNHKCCDYRNSKSKRDELKQKKRRQKIRGHAGNFENLKFNRQRKMYIYKKLSSCKICGKSFTRRGSLGEHMRTHTGEKPFSCPTCRKSFSQRGNLARHIKSHTGERSFSCFICGKGFFQQIHLTCHIRTHTGEKPFSCVICGRTFSQESNLTVHVKTHQGEQV